MSKMVPEPPTEQALRERAYVRLGKLVIALPAEQERQGIGQGALRGILHDVYRYVAAGLWGTVGTALDQLLVADTGRTQSPGDTLKATPSAPWRAESAAASNHEP